MKDSLQIFRLLPEKTNSSRMNLNEQQMREIISNPKLKTRVGRKCISTKAWEQLKLIRKKFNRLTKRFVKKIWDLEMQTT